MNGFLYSVCRPRAHGPHSQASHDELMAQLREAQNEKQAAQQAARAQRAQAESLREQVRALSEREPICCLSTVALLRCQWFPNRKQ